MIVKAPYEGSSTEPKAVLFCKDSTVPKTLAVHSHHFPVTNWQLANNMNNAYILGYRQALADVRATLGIIE